jgi:DNA repair exonuclease SbcCD ATPase subunit
MENSNNENKKTIKRGRKLKVEQIESLENVDHIDSNILQKINFDDDTNINIQSTSTSKVKREIKTPKPKPTPRKKPTSHSVTLDSVMHIEETVIENVQSSQDIKQQLQHQTSNLTIRELDNNFTKPIKTIFHISDLHIQLYKRHKEYLEVFTRVFEYLKTQKQNQTTNRNIPMITVITGDLLHSKSDLSPECIQLTYNFIKTLASILPVVIIPGNHDININNRERLDSITPIIADLPINYPVYYLLESGVYKLSNLLFYHASIFDYKIIKPVDVMIDSNMIPLDGIHFHHIGLYHGRVNGAVLFNGLELLSGTGNKTITPNTFKDYDITLLGDIHKHQFLKCDGSNTHNIAYSGSLIQQNMGESIKEHGLIKWDIEKRMGELIEIYNDWSYITMYVENKKADYYCTNADGTHSSSCQLSKHLRVRILYKNTPESYLSDLITLLKMNHDVLEYSWQQQETETLLENIIEPSSNTITNIEFQNSETIQKKTGLMIDITSVDVQNQYILEYLRENEAEIQTEDLEEIKRINIEQNQILRANLKGTKSILGNYAFNGHYKIKRLEFSNLFSFGEGNVIDFSDFKGVVGIIAANHLGKSSIIDIIIYTLFDEFTRKGSTKDIININKDNFHIKLTVGIGQWTYTIVKTGSRSKVGATVKIEFYRVNDATHITERLEEDNAAKTKERIMEYFGCYEDIIHTSFSIQHNNACFIDSTNVKRKDELERIMRFEIIKKLTEIANSKYNKDNAIYEHIKKKINNDDIVTIKKAKNKSLKILDIITNDRNYAKGKIKQLNNDILSKTGQLNHECNDFNEKYNENECHSKLKSINETITQLELDRTNLYKDMDCEEGLEVTKKKDICNEERELLEVIKTASNKIKQLNSNNEKIYKARKSVVTKGDKLYLKELLDGYVTEKETLQNKSSIVHENLNILKDKQKLLESNNKQILILEKTIKKLPDEIIELSSEYNHSELEHEYNKAFIVLLNIHTISSNVILKTTNEWENYNNIARKYFLGVGLESYIDDATSAEEKIVKEQKKLEDINKQITKALDTGIKPLEMELKQYENHINTLDNQIKQVRMDMENLEVNSKLDLDIQENKLRIEKYEGRIDEANMKMETIKQTIKLIARLEKILLDRKLKILEKEKQEEILYTFEMYKKQMEANKPILADIDLLTNELKEFEDILDLVENAYINEQGNVTKYTALLEQIKKDLKEGKELEKTLRISEIYRNALKQLPYILLNKIQPILEKKVNDLLTIITDFTIKFDISDGKIDIYLDRNIYKDKTRNIIINNASGFERFIASLAIRIALLELSNLPKINFMAIDEGWSSFDTHNINNVGTILEYLTNKFDFILTISHLIQIKEHCDIQLNLKKDDRGFSKIVY